MTGRAAFSVDGVVEALEAQPVRLRGGRALLLVSARQSEDATHVARAVAEAARGKAVYAIDLDLRRNSLARALSETAPLGPKRDGRIGGALFYTIHAPDFRRLGETTPVFSFHRVGRSRIHAGVFDGRSLPRGAGVGVSAAPDYWDAARAAGATVVVSAPALERSKVSLRVAAHMDGVVLIVDADAGGGPAALTAQKALVDAGSNLIGLVYCGPDAQVIAMDRVLRQAG